MKKQIQILAIIFLIPFAAFSTEQTSDYIIYKEDKCELVTHWLFPSPLQVYFTQNKSVKNPFKWRSTANYRGHIATYESAEGKLFLVAIEPDRNSEESFDEKKEKTNPEDYLKNIFGDKVTPEGKVFANWFSGNIRVFAKSEKKKYKHQEDKKGYELESFSEIVLIQLNGGVITRETSFPINEYWNKFRLYLKYRKLPQEQINAIAEHARFLDRFDKEWEKIGNIEPKGKVHSEKDFSVFLTRYLTKQVNIPLTDFAIVKDATIHFGDSSYIIGSDLRIRKGNHILFLEMGASNVPNGPWNNFTGGSVQLVVNIGDLKTKKITFNEKDTGLMNLINNFGGALNPQKKVDGVLHFNVAHNSTVTVSGHVKLSSKDPTTYQEIILEDNNIPVYSVKDYLKLQYDPDDPIPQNAEEVYKEILNKSKNN